MLDVITTDFVTSVLSFGRTDGTFGGAVTLSSVGNASGYDNGDFNHDGYLDLVTVSSGNIERVFFGDGNGGMALAQTFSSVSGLTMTNIHAKDLNGDGVLDLLYTTFSFSASEVGRTLLGNVDGSFGMAATFWAGIAGGSTKSLLFGDFDGDASVDVISSSELKSSTNYLSKAVAKRTTAEAYVDLSNVLGARGALTTLSTQLDRLTGQLGSLGASESRIGFEVATIRACRENFQRAESSLMNVDIAAESGLRVTGGNRQQASVALLAQANFSPQIVLKLLKGAG